MKVTDKFTVVVEATDRGEVVKLSSSTTVIINIQDGNNNLPTISRQTVGVTAAAVEHSSCRPPVGLSHKSSRERVYRKHE